VTGWVSHISIGALVIEAFSRTAVYVTRMSGGVGGGGLTASPYPNSALSNLTWGTTSLDYRAYMSDTVTYDRE
jgi:hypothetical protein